MIPALAVVKEMPSNRVLVGAADGLGDGARRGAGLAGPMARGEGLSPAGHHMCEWVRRPGGSRTCCSRWRRPGTDTRKLVKRLIALAEPLHILIMGSCGVHRGGDVDGHSLVIGYSL